MGLASEDWERINGCLLRLYRELDTERHARVMLEILNDLVPADSTVLNYFKPPHELTCITLPERFVTDEQVALVAKYGHQSPYGAYYVATQDASWKMTTDFMPAEEFHKLDIHRFALGPLGINYQIGGILAVMDDTCHIITIHRTHQNFTEREREILNTLHPHLVTSYVNALACSQARDSVAQIKAVVDTAPGAYAYFDASGKAAWMQDKAGAWLREFFNDEVKTSRNIPHSIDLMLDESAREGGAPKQLVKTGPTENLTVCLGSSAVGGWILRLERKPNTPAPRYRSLPQFSDRKNDVLKWMVEGKRNGEIATILGLSSRTVEKHVQDILTELRVENRATAIIRAMELCAVAQMAAQSHGAGI
jgi:DNA-binding CsgD family transcriptional regulator